MIHIIYFYIVPFTNLHSIFYTKTNVLSVSACLCILVYLFDFSIRQIIRFFLILDKDKTESGDAATTLEVSTLD